MIRAAKVGGGSRPTAGPLARVTAILLCLAAVAVGARANDAAAAPAAATPARAAGSAAAEAVPAAGIDAIHGATPTDAAAPGAASDPSTAPAVGAAPSLPAAPAPAKNAAASFRNDYALLLGAQYWDRLDDFDPAIPPGATGRAGRFEPAGVNVELSYHRQAARWLGWDVLLGGTGGLFYHTNKEDYDVTILPSGTRIEGALSARGLYLMPSVKLFSGEPRPWRFSLGAGAGLVYVEFENSLEDGMTVDTYFREETLGAYLSAGADRILSRSSMSILLRLEAKALFADFGSMGGFAPGAGRLTGPIFLFQVGVAVAD